jgi:hypothetical protein
MTTVVSRTFRSSPHRDALQTWDAIVELLTQGKDGTARSELRAVAGVSTLRIAGRAIPEPSRRGSGPVICAR